MLKRQLRNTATVLVGFGVSWVLYDLSYDVSFVAWLERAAILYVPVFMLFEWLCERDLARSDQWKQIWPKETEE